MSCTLCHGTKVVVDGGTTFPCVCKKKTQELSPVDAVIYGTTYAVVLDRRLQAARSYPGYWVVPEAMEHAELAAVKDAVEAAGIAVRRFHEIAGEVHSDWEGTATEKLYTAAGGPQT